MAKLAIILFLCTLYSFTGWAQGLTRASSVLPSNLSTDVNRNALYVEVLGRGGLFSLGYERATSDRATIGIGYSYQSLQVSPSAASGMIQLQTLPIYTNIYYRYGSHRPFFSAGVTFLNVKSEANLTLNNVFKNFSASGFNGEEESNFEVDMPEFNNSVNMTLALPSLGLGYEYRMRSGAFTRMQALAMIFEKPFIWAGCSIGVGF